MNIQREEKSSSAVQTSKRILLVLDFLGKGGTEVVALRLAETLVLLGHRVVLIQLLPERNRAIPAGIHHECWDISPKELKQAPRRRVAAVDEHFARLEEEGGAFNLVLLSWVHSHVLVEQFPADRTWLWQHTVGHKKIKGFSKLLPKSPRWWHQLKAQPAIRRWLPRSDRIYSGRCVVSVSSGALQNLESTRKVHLSRKRVIHNPLNIAEFRLSAQGDVPAPKPAVVWAGRFAPDKQPEHAIEAFVLSGVQGHLWMLGDGERLDAVKQLAKERGVAGRVHFPGFVADVPRWIANSQGLMFTSRHLEALPTVLCEALALGKPCISYDCPCGPSEILRGPLAQGLIPTNDIPAMARALRRMVENPVLPLEEEQLRFDAGKIAIEFLTLCA